jgi:2-octaprenyl-6-methoxyphenol hydroxylase
MTDTHNNAAANTATAFDVAICGAGPAGMALAALLVKRGMPADRVALIDAKTLAQAGKDPRSIALSYGSRQILEEIGAWPVPATAIHQIHVSRRGQFGRSLIDRDDHRLPALGYVLRYGDLVAALGAVCERAGVTTLRPARVRRSMKELIRWADDRRRPAGNGARFDRRAGGRRFVQRSGEQVATPRLPANRDHRQVRGSRPVEHRAFERFTEQGPLALLPQGEEYSLVWCVRPDVAASLQALDDQAFLDQLSAAFGDRVGRFTKASMRLAFPLGLNADPRATARTVAIGNAAQTLHPVAGQGLNLGLRDATVLARLLAQGATPQMLAQFTALRQQDRGTTVRLTDTMARVFANESPTQALLGLSLAAIDMVGPARGMLAELMMYGRR